MRAIYSAIKIEAELKSSSTANSFARKMSDTAHAVFRTGHAVPYIIGTSFTASAVTYPVVPVLEMTILPDVPALKL